MDMGMVRNAVIPHDELEDTAYEWAQKFKNRQ
jgi:1,4-dihydroxy-2-naphthoyl-CoA synthase